VVGLAIVPVAEGRRLLLARRGSPAGGAGESPEGVPVVTTSA
jgi:hypothetical protein